MRGVDGSACSWWAFQQVERSWAGHVGVYPTGRSSFEGLVAGFVDIGAKWMSHWRTGVCAPALWLNREQCCWSSTDVEFDDVHNEICQHVSLHLSE